MQTLYRHTFFKINDAYRVQQTLSVKNENISLFAEKKIEKKRIKLFVHSWFILALWITIFNIFVQNNARKKNEKEKLFCCIFCYYKFYKQKLLLDQNVLRRLKYMFTFIVCSVVLVYRPERNWVVCFSTNLYQNKLGFQLLTLTNFN